MDEDERKWRSYESAQNLARSEVTNVWQRFYVFLALHTFLLGGAVFAEPIVPRSVLGAVGLFICLLWFSMLRRGFTYYNCYIRYAREREKLLEEHDLLQRGYKLSEGTGITVAEKPLLMPWSGRILKAQVGTYVIVCIFILSYATLIAKGLGEWFCQK